MNKIKRKSLQNESERQLRLSRNAQVYYALPRRSDLGNTTSTDKSEGAGWVLAFGGIGIGLSIFIIVGIVSVIAFFAEKYGW